MTRCCDWSLYFVTDRNHCNDRDFFEVLIKAVQGGVSVVQLREKTLCTREYVTLGKHILSLLKPYGVPFMINDRVDIALAIGADGVHLGTSDLQWADARRILGPEKIIGLSVETEDELRDTANSTVDYLALSPVFATTTKLDTAPPWGLDGIKRARALTHHPLIAIGGIHSGNAEAVIHAGCDGVAVVSAIQSAASPFHAARDLKQRVVRARNL